MNTCWKCGKELPNGQTECPMCGIGDGSLNALSEAMREAREASELYNQKMQELFGNADGFSIPIKLLYPKEVIDLLDWLRCISVREIEYGVLSFLGQVQRQGPERYSRLVATFKRFLEPVPETEQQFGGNPS